MMNDRIRSTYAEWEKIIRNFIRKAEECRALGAAEVAKSLLLYGMNLYAQMTVGELSDKDYLMFISELRRRTNLVVQNCLIDEGFVDPDCESPTDD